MNTDIGHRSHEQEPKTKVRQGVTGHNVRRVLLISLGLSALALMAAYFHYAG
jgi:hypothetical protein